MQLLIFFTIHVVLANYLLGLLTENTMGMNRLKINIHHLGYKTQPSIGK